jgi:hypothetical protein
VRRSSDACFAAGLERDRELHAARGELPAHLRGLGRRDELVEVRRRHGRHARRTTRGVPPRRGEPVDRAAADQLEPAVGRDRRSRDDLAPATTTPVVSGSVRVAVSAPTVKRSDAVAVRSPLARRRAR